MAIRKDGHVIRNPIPEPQPPEQPVAQNNPFPDIPGEPTYSEIQQAVQQALQQQEEEEISFNEPDEIEIEVVDELPQEPEPEIQPHHPPMVYAPISETGKAFICVSDELKEHYEQIIRTRDNILSDPEASGGEQAAIINATTTALKELLKMQKEAYNADMLARIQQEIVSALAESAPHIKDRVLKSLEEHLEQIG